MRTVTLALLLSVIISGAQEPGPPPAAADPYAQMEVLTRAMEIIRQNYVDEKKTGYDRLVAAAVRGMLHELDPHCQYIAPELNEELLQTLENSPDGAGFTLAPAREGW